MSFFGYFRTLLGFGRGNHVITASTEQSEDQLHGVESKAEKEIEDVAHREDAVKPKITHSSTAGHCYPLVTSTSKGKRLSLRKTRLRQEKRLLRRYRQRKMFFLSRASDGRKAALHRAGIGALAKKKALETSMSEMDVNGDVSMEEAVTQQPTFECGACLEPFTIYDNDQSSSLMKRSKGGASSSAIQAIDEKTALRELDGKGLIFRCQSRFCCNCLRDYIRLRLKDAGRVDKFEPVSCAMCKAGHSKPKCVTQMHIKLVLSKADYEKYEQVLLIESMSSQMYCPNPSCAAIYDAREITRDGRNFFEPAEKVKCPLCSAIACIECKTIWHEGFTCESYKSRPLFLRDADDAETKVIELAKKQGWARCPTCGEGIELKDGCNHMTCKCGHNFCYLCLSDWSSTIRNGATVEKCSRGNRGGDPCPLYTENSLRGLLQRQGPMLRRQDMKWISEDRKGVPYQKSNTFTRHMLASKSCGYCDFKSKKWNGLINHLETIDHDVFHCCAKFYKSRGDFDSHVRNSHPRRQWIPAEQVLHLRA